MAGGSRFLDAEGRREAADGEAVKAPAGID